MAIEVEINNSSEDGKEFSILYEALKRIRENLLQKYPEHEGFKMIETKLTTGDKPDIGSVSYFRPISTIKYKMSESEKDKHHKFEILSGKTTGAEVTIGMNESYIPKLNIKVEWTSAMYNRLITIALTMAVILSGIGIIGACVEKYQQGSGMELLLYFVLPWKFLWMVIISLLVTLIPAMIIAWLLAKLIYLFGPKQFSKNELVSLQKELMEVVKSDAYH